MTQSLTDAWPRWKAVIDEPLVVATIDRSNETWLTAEAIASKTGLPPDCIQMVLDNSAGGVIVALLDGQGGPLRYSTREHYRATTGFLTRYVDALVSS